MNFNSKEGSVERLEKKERLVSSTGEFQKKAISFLQKPWQIKNGRKRGIVSNITSDFEVTWDGNV